MAVGVLLAYSDSFHGAFVFDDPTSITGNTTIRHLTHLGAILRTPRVTVTAEGRPVLNLTLALNWAAGGARVEGYHIVNLAIHLLAALLLAGVLSEILRRVPRLRAQAGPLAWAVALLWALHPLQTESVTYIIQRAESLMGLLYLLTLYAFLRGSSTGRAGWWIVAWAACLAGMATKEDMVSAPLAVFVCDGLLVAGSFEAAWRQRWRLHVALAATWVLLAALIAGTGGNRGGSVGFGLDVSWKGYWLTQFPAISRYLALTFWPHPLVFEYGTVTVGSMREVWAQAVLVAFLLAATVIAWIGRRRAPAAAFAAFVFWAVLAPTSLIPGTTQMIVEHRMYLPLACVLAVLAGAGGLRWPWATVMILLAASIPAGFRTWKRNADYRDARTLWELTVRQRPNNVLAMVMLGDALRRGGDEDAALRMYERAVELRPRYPLAHEMVGESLVRRGQWDAAMDHFRAAMRVRPDYADAHDNLGQAFARRNETGPALGQFRRAAALKPGWLPPHYHLARELARQGEKAEAEREFRRALAIDPDYRPARDGLAALKTGSGSSSAAVLSSAAASPARP